MRVVMMTAAAICLAAAAPAMADQYIEGYYRQGGTYVEPYHRSSPDGLRDNNFSTRGNMNPYTGSAGSRDPSGSDPFAPRRR